MAETKAQDERYQERVVFENEAVRQMERAAVTGEEPTVEQLMALMDERVTQYARFKVERGVLRLRWYEEREREPELEVPVLDLHAKDPALESARYAEAVQEWAAGR